MGKPMQFVSLATANAIFAKHDVRYVGLAIVGDRDSLPAHVEAASGKLTTDVLRTLPQDEQTFAAQVVLRAVSKGDAK